jgi:hypothetical protein
MNTTPQRDLVARYIAAYNAFDIDAMLAELALDVRFENWSGGQLTVSSDGIDAFRALAEQARGMFSQREQRITEWLPQGDALLVRIDWRGTLAVDMPDGPAAGTEFALSGESEFAFAHGRIARIVDRG